MEMLNKMRYIKVKSIRDQLMDTEKSVLKMVHFFKEILIKGNLTMEYFCFLIAVIMQEILKNFKPQAKVYIRIYKMVIITKANGKKIYKMVKECKNIQIKISMLVALCMVVNLDKEYISLQMEKFIKAPSIMGLAMVMGN